MDKDLLTQFESFYHKYKDIASQEDRERIDELCTKRGTVIRTLTYSGNLADIEKELCIRNVQGCVKRPTYIVKEAIEMC